MKYLFSIFLVLLLSFTPLLASDTNMFEAVARVHTMVSQDMADYGTATCINLDDDFVYLLTNAHVVRDKKTAQVEFFRQGYKSIEITAEVSWKAFAKNQPKDMALLKVDRKKLNNFVPAIVKFPLDGKIYSVGQTVMTIGCPQAGWPRAYKGHIVKVVGGTYVITPNVEPGQSGSILLNEDGTKAIGLIAWSDDGFGKAMTAETISAAVLGKQTNYFLNQPYKIQDVEGIPVDQVVRLRGRFNNRPDNDCPNCDENGCRPRQNPNQDKNPRQRKQDQPEETPSDNNNDGGLKIFPTFPGDQQPSNDKPAIEKPKVEAPKVDDSRVVTLETKVNDLTSKFADAYKKNDAEHIAITKELAELDGKIGSFGKVDTSGLATKDDLSNAVKDVITPGKLTQQLQPIIEATTPGKIDSLISASAVVKDLKDKALNVVKSQDLTDLSDRLNKAITDGKTELSKRVDSTVVESNKTFGTVLKEIITNNKETKEASGDNTVNQYGTTAVATLIPTLGALLLGWFFKDKFGTNSNTAVIIAQTVANEIKSHLGGVVSQPPFPKSQPTPIAAK